MTTMVTRAAKGSPLTWGEVDANFTNLNENKVETINPTSSGTLTHSGDIVLSGSGKRLTGDFSNATFANRVLFQTNTVNGGTNIGIIPNGTGTQSGIKLETDSTVTNGSVLALDAVGGSDARISSNIRGTGSYLPMTFYTGGSEAARFETNHLFNITGINNTAYYGLAFNGRILRKRTFDMAVELVNNANTAVTHLFMDDGSLLLMQPGGLGYGTGSGGTVTQTTSKSTAVTLNKPTGQITTHNAALAANTVTSFVFNNSLLAATDVLHVSTAPGTYTPAAYNIWVTVNSGAATVHVKNISPGSLSEAVVINFAIIKGATA